MRRGIAGRHTRQETPAKPVTAVVGNALGHWVELKKDEGEP